MSRRKVSLALAAAYAALAVLVATGPLNVVDQWSIDHLMPGLGDADRKPSLAEAAIPLRHANWSSVLGVVANVVTLPAQAIVSSALLGVCCLVLWRRHRRRAALAWSLAWLVGNAVEILCKSVLTRPLLHGHVHTLVAFESSYPSGHTLRSVLLAAAVTSVWPRVRPLVAAWAVASLVLLEIDGFHVPSDILGGLLLALLVIGAVWERTTTNWTSSPPFRPSSSSS